METVIFSLQQFNVWKKEHEEQKKEKCQELSENLFSFLSVWPAIGLSFD